MQDNPRRTPPGEYGLNKVVGDRTSPLPEQPAGLRHRRLLHADGRIIGGLDYQDSLHRAGTERAMEVDVTTSGKPDKREVYGMINALTDTK